MPFEIGSIFAKIGIDTSGAKKAFEDTVAGAQKMGAGITAAAEKAGVSINQAIGTKQIQQAFDQATAAAERFGATVSKNLRLLSKPIPNKIIDLGPLGPSAALTEFEKLKSQFAAARQASLDLSASRAALDQALVARQRIIDLGTAIGTNLRQSFDGVIGGFKALGSAAAGAFNFITRSVSQVTGAVTRLGRTLISLPTLLAGFGTFKILERAAEVDDVTTAFDHLSKSIGAIGSTFLPKLRAATRGTVSDLELMRSANDAILLGVAKDADAFAELTENARRLGQAVGRDTVKALNDVVSGIGRQSFRILDNIGILVRAGEAYDAFAVKIGKTRDQLTDAERRLAFTIAVQERARKEVLKLGPDVLTVGQQFRRLGATISNTFSDIAQTIVSGGALGSLADLIDANRPRIAAFVGFVRDKVEQIVNAIVVGFGRLQSGKLGVFDFLDATIGGALRTLGTLVGDLVTNLLPAFIEAGIALGEAIGNGLLATVKKAGIKVRIAVNNFLGDIVRGSANVLVKIGQLLGQVPNIPGLQFDIADQLFGNIQEQFNLLDRELNELFDRSAQTKDVKDSFLKQFKDISVGLGDIAAGIKQPTQEFLDQIIDFRGRVGAALQAPALEQAEDKFRAKLLGGFEKIGAGAKTIFRKIDQEITAGAGLLTGRIAEEAEKSATAEAVARERLRDPLTGARPIQVDSFIQPLADGINKIVELRAKALLAFGQFIPKSAVDVSAGIVDILIKRLEVAAGAVKLFRKAFAPPHADEQDFAAFISLANDRIAQLKVDSLTQGFTAGAKALAEFDNRANQLFTVFSPSQLQDLEAARNAIIGFTEVGEATKALAGLEDELRAIGKTGGEKIADNIKRSLETFKTLEPFKNFGAEIDDVLKSFHAVIPADVQIVQSSFDKAKDKIQELKDKLAEPGAGEKLSGEIQSSITSVTEELKSQFGVLFVEELPDDVRIALDNVVSAFRRGLDINKFVSDLQKAIDKAPPLQLKVDVSKAAESVKDLEEGLAQGFNRIGPGEKIAADIQKEIDRVQFDPQVKLTPEVLADLAKLRDKAQAALRIQAQFEFQDLSKEVGTSIFTGITDGFEQGISAAKIWSNIVSDIFRKSMTRVIDGLTTTISNALGGVFKQLGLGLGAADLATGLLGIGSAILVGIRNRRDQNVQDFSQQINSSEAIRGVVAGPTNVAIARVGDQLRSALHTTEVLLTQILETLQRGGGTVSVPGSGFSIRMTPSTQS